MKDDRGELDLTRRIDELEEALDGYLQLVVMQKNEIWGLKQIQSQNESNKNLLQGYNVVLPKFLLVPLQQLENLN